MTAGPKYIVRLYTRVRRHIMDSRQLQLTFAAIFLEENIFKTDYFGMYIGTGKQRPGKEETCLDERLFHP